MLIYSTFRRLLQACLVSLMAAAALAQTTPLPFKPVASEYSKKLDRLILISTNPNRLHIYNPVTAETVSLSLAQPPLSLSIGTDGLHAAVGHDALISYVDLEKGVVQKQLDVPTVAASVIATSSWIYTVGTYAAKPYSVNIDTGEAIPNTAAFTMTGGRFNVAANTIYGTRDGTSPNDVERWDISTGPVTRETDSPYHGDYCIYGPVWFSPDWNRIYTGCGTVFRASTDPKLDMYYLSSIPGVTRISSLDESSALRKIALVRRNDSWSSGTQVDEGVVQIFESPYLVPSGQFTLSGFAAGGKTYAPHASAVFFKADSTELIVVKQADASSGLLNDYAVERIPLSATAPCGATFSEGSVAVPAEGVTGVVTIKAPASCVYEATSMVPWITIVSGGFGSGNGTLQWAVAANSDSIARMGTILLPGQVFTVTQAVASSPASSPLYLPGYDAVDAAYVKALDRFVLVSANPNQLHIVDPVARRDTVVPLNAPPLSLSVRPDGAQAAVGHDGWVTLVDLTMASVLKVISVPTDVHRLILAGNGYVYLFPARDWGDLFSLELSSEQVTRTSAIYNGREPRLHVNGRSIYVGGAWQSKWDISNGVAKLANGLPNTGCGKLWLTEDGRRMFGECGKAYTTSEVPAQDYQYNGSLSDTTQVVWLDESAKAETTAVIPSEGPSYLSATKSNNDTQVQLYNDSYLAYLGAISLPTFRVGGNEFPAHGRYVFWDQSGTGLYAIVQADTKALLTGGTGIVQLSVSDVKQVAVTTVVNSASQAQGRIAPGEVISIYGSGMGPKGGVSFTVDPATKKISTNLAGTEVFLNSLPAPVLYASDTQVNAVVPYESPISGQATLQVARQGILAPGFAVTMAEAVPGIYTMDGSGAGQAVAVNLDGTVCDSAHPAAPGSYIIVYFTGGGSTTPPPSTGSVAGATLKRLWQTARATVGDVPATVSFAGAAPSFVEGVNQLNLRLDEKTPAGPAQKLILTVGNNSSPATATIAVK